MTVIKNHILIVDDVAENIQVAMNILREDGYQFSYASNGSKALELVAQRGQDFDLILLDVMMPGLNGFEVCKVLKTGDWHSIPVVFLTARADIDSMEAGFEAGGVDYITKPFHSAELLARVKTHLELYQAKRLLQEKAVSLATKLAFNQRRLMSELENSQQEMLWMLIDLMGAASGETAGHVTRVAGLASLFAELHPSLTEHDSHILFHASPLHDIGKMMVPPEILNKPGKYTEEEFEVMKTHTSKAYKLLSKSNRKLVNAAAIIAHEHHEKWDGSGYPRGLAGQNIHIFGRIVAIVDVLDALINERVYKKAWVFDDAIAYLLEHSGSHFDPELVQLLVNNKNRFVALIDRAD